MTQEKIKLTKEEKKLMDAWVSYQIEMDWKDPIQEMDILIIDMIAKGHGVELPEGHYFLFEGDDCIQIEKDNAEIEKERKRSEAIKAGQILLDNGYDLGYLEINNIRLLAIDGKAIIDDSIPF